MKKSILGLSFGVLLMLLMCAAMISPPAQEETAAAPRVPEGRAMFLLPSCPPPAAQETEKPKQPAQKMHIAASALQSGRTPVRLSADANGVPILEVTYRRSNFRAFHFSDEAG